MIPLVAMKLEELQAVMKKWGQPQFRAKQILTWIYKKAAADIDCMSDLPEPLRARLKKEYVASGLGVEETRTANDGTRKLLIRLEDGNFIEAVAIPVEKRVVRRFNGQLARSRSGRLTGCISSQVGCKYGCIFCASGMRAFRRNLSVAEMAAEVLLLNYTSPAQELSHIVFMGIGEPLDNYDNVLKTVRLINAPDGFGIGARRITISTCGVVPGILRLADEGLQIELSVSLHAADDATRNRIMPVNRKYPLAVLMHACREYIRKTNRQVTFEYVLIEGINSDLQNAQKLSTLIAGTNCKINIIPFNPAAAEVTRIAQGRGFTAPDVRQVRDFMRELNQLGVHATARAARGQDIEAACGQLRLRYEKK